MTDPVISMVFITTLMCLLLVYIFRKSYQSWDEQNWMMKSILRTIAFGAIVFTLLSLIVIIFPPELN
ncbi:MAG TPA: hypothetical protein DF712_14300 [Balneola sp.]|jgi:amino acid transporter|nr:hypothetical protein [Bacteroidota bacterium]MAC05905.1 hypothetical protein [Balneola sp.]MAO77430.1 hypothetical protein [Balneola sp.]MBF65388.1 hypothetical protein [Balneola sp.]HAH52326.1 hypothetical protein [Balneola sp.]